MTPTAKLARARAGEPVKQAEELEE